MNNKQNESKQRIVAQDNGTIARLVQQVQTAGQALNANMTSANADAFNVALQMLGVHMAAFWKAGYRLTLEE